MKFLIIIRYNSIMCEHGFSTAVWCLWLQYWMRSSRVSPEWDLLAIAHRLSYCDEQSQCPLRSLGTACWVSHPHVYTLHVEENSYPIGRYHVEMPSPKRISKASRRYSEQYQSTQLKSSDRHRLRWTNIVISWEQDALSVSFLSFFLLFLFNTEIIYSSPSKMRRTVS